MQNKPNTIDQFYDYFLTTSLTPTGLAWASGAWWKEQRTFALTTLRKFGFGKRCLQSQVIEEVDCLMDEFEKYEGKPFNIHYQLNSVCPTSFVLCCLENDSNTRTPNSTVWWSYWTLCWLSLISLRRRSSSQAWVDSVSLISLRQNPQ